jgi:hypothetical protein
MHLSERREFLTQLGSAAGLGLCLPLSALAGRENETAALGGGSWICPQYKYMEGNGYYYYYAMHCPIGGNTPLIHNTNIACPQPCYKPPGTPNPYCPPESMLQFKEKAPEGDVDLLGTESHNVTPEVKKGTKDYADDNVFPHKEKGFDPAVTRIASRERCWVQLSKDGPKHLVKIVRLHITPKDPEDPKKYLPTLVVGIGQELDPKKSTSTLPGQEKFPYTNVSKLDGKYFVLSHLLGGHYHVILKA